jgi:hypothetical protein
MHPEGVMARPWLALASSLDRLSSGWTIVATVALYALYLTSIMPAQSLESRAYAGDWGAPDRHFFYTPGELYAEIATWGTGGRQQYVDFRLGLDIGFALTYTAFLITITGVAVRRAWPDDPRRRLLLLVPLVPMACDLLENALGIGLVAVFPARLPLLAWLAAGVTALKWTCLAAAHVVMLYAVLAALGRLVRRT